MCMKLPPYSSSPGLSTAHAIISPAIYSILRRAIATPGMNHQPEPVGVVGNLPYFITSDILLRLFEFRSYFSLIVLMVQREVADRLAAAPGRSDYGLLSATAQLYARVEKMFTLPPSAFSPPPKVDSTLVRLRIAPKLDSLQVPEAEFVNFLKLAFGQ